MYDDLDYTNNNLFGHYILENVINELYKHQYRTL